MSQTPDLCHVHPKLDLSTAPPAVASPIDPWIRVGLARGLAAFLGGFTLLNLLGDVRCPGFDANIWWIDLRGLPIWVGRTLLGLGGLGLVAYAVFGGLGRWLGGAAAGATAALLAASATNVLTFWRLLSVGEIQSRVPIPFSLLICGCLGVILIAQIRLPQPVAARRTGLVALGVFALCLPVFPAAQMFCFGRTDYRRRADVAVVLGARAYADGQPSDALADRVRTGCELYRDGLVHKLIMSGGPGDGRFHETEVMRAMAIGLGVRAEAILLDADGMSTQATVDNTVRLFDEMGTRRVLVVSHFYHLPRIKMAYQRGGCEVYTVPARESYTLTMTPYFMLREVAALWLYYLRPLFPVDRAAAAGDMPSGAEAGEPPSEKDHQAGRRPSPGPVSSPDPMTPLSYRTAAVVLSQAVAADGRSESYKDTSPIGTGTGPSGPRFHGRNGGGTGRPSRAGGAQVSPCGLLIG